MSYTIVEDDDGTPRISAVTADGMEIVGARVPKGDVHWRLYINNRISDDAVHCHPIVCSRNDARSWVKMIATLYSLGAQQRVGAA